MILSGKEIERRPGADIVIEPFAAECLNPNSYNLRLHDEMLEYRNHELDMRAPTKPSPFIWTAGGFLLNPDGSTSAGPSITPKPGTSYRCSLAVPPSAGRVCQIFYHTIERDFVDYHSGKYQKNKGIQPSLIFREFQ